MKNIKKLLTIALSIGLIGINVTALPMSTYADTEAKNYDIDKDSLYWDITDTKVMVGWDEAEDKTSYKVKLFKGSKGISSYITTNKPSYDFTNYILEKGTGTYKFYVYASKQGKDSQKVSETQTIDSEQLSELRKNTNYKPSTKTTSNNNNKKASTGVTYTGAVSTTTKNTGPGANLPSTATTDTNTNTNSSTAPNSTKGWTKIDNNWYWLNEDNTLANNTWKEVNGKWYFFNEKSIMVTGWKEINNLWYYFDNTNGDMLVNTVTPDNHTVDANGVWVR